MPCQRSDIAGKGWVNYVAIGNQVECPKDHNVTKVVPGYNISPDLCCGITPAVSPSVQKAEMGSGLNNKRSKAKEQIENNFSYHPPKEGQPQIYTSIRNMAKDLAMAIDSMCPDSREKSTALTRLEECVFWCNAGISRCE